MRLLCGKRKRHVWKNALHSWICKTSIQTWSCARHFLLETNICTMTLLRPRKAHLITKQWLQHYFDKHFFAILDNHSTFMLCALLLHLFLVSLFIFLIETPKSVNPALWHNNDDGDNKISHSILLFCIRYTLFLFYFPSPSFLLLLLTITWEFHVYKWSDDFVSLLYTLTISLLYTGFLHID